FNAAAKEMRSAEEDQRSEIRDQRRRALRSTTALIARICIATDHKSHDVVLLEKAADDEKANIIARAELVKEKKEVCRDVIREFENTEHELETNITTAKRQVRSLATSEKEDGNFHAKFVAKVPDSGPERLDHPFSCVCYEEKLFVTDKYNNCVKVFDGKGKFLYKFGEEGNGDGQLNQPYGLCFTLEGTFTGKASSNIQFGRPLGVTPMLDDRIVTEHELETNISTAKRRVSQATEQMMEKLRQLEHRVEIHIDPADRVRSLVTSEKEDRCFQAKFVGEVPQAPTGIGVNSKDQCNHRIQQLNVQTGNFVKSFGEQGSGDGEFQNP
ncbi:hypothetical protein pdam_00025515, partial [Pocillopora damicornis]